MTKFFISALLSSTMLIALISCDGGGNSSSGTNPGVEVGDSTFGVKDPKDGETEVTILDPQEPDEPAVVARPRQKLAHYVNTMRGANSSGDFTRGNTFPATAVPFGFNFWTPINRQDKNWFYQFRTTTGYPTDGGALIDKVTDFAVVHMPSPWIGNRQSLSIMPISDTSKTTHNNRGERFSRENEIAKAHYYSLKFDNGVRTEITPTDRAAVFRFTAAEGSDVQTILFDRFAASGTGELEIIDLEKGILQGQTDLKDGKNSPPLYFYVTFSAPIKNAEASDTKTVKRWVQFDVSKNPVIEMKIATSFMSVEQAKANLESEVGQKSFDQIKDAAEALWDERLNMIISYANIFDKNGRRLWWGGFFRQKDEEGNFVEVAKYPGQWGYAYTEGNGWSYAFLAPHDGDGLASLYGGRKGLKQRLDTFFTSTPSTEKDVAGSYGWVIHEIKEARAVNELAGVGEYQHSNQPVHHSIYMYNFVGSPSTGQKYLRDVMDKLYFSGFDANGNSDGSGYIGDEDNGEQSAWYIFSAMGFYPVAVGRAEYAIGAPYFPKMNVAFKREDGSESVLEISAPSVSPTNRYVQSVTLNGEAITRNYLLHSEIANGGKLEFVMGPNPSVTWGTGENDVPSSTTKPGVEPKPLKSAVPAGKLTLSSNVTEEIDKLSDRNSLTKWVAGQGANYIEAKAATDAPVTAKIYTLTSSDNVSTLAGWTLKGSNDAANWEIIDKRQFSAENPAFKWPRQLRPFSIKDPKSFRHYRIEFDGATPIELGELEFLAEIN